MGTLFVTFWNTPLWNPPCAPIPTPVCCPAGNQATTPLLGPQHPGVQPAVEATLAPDRVLCTQGPECGPLLQMENIQDTKHHAQGWPRDPCSHPSQRSPSGSLTGRGLGSTSAELSHWATPLPPLTQAGEPPGLHVPRGQVSESPTYRWGEKLGWGLGERGWCAQVGLTTPLHAPSSPTLGTTRRCHAWADIEEPVRLPRDLAPTAAFAHPVQV